MSTTYRFMKHTIRHIAEGGVTYETFCVAAGCGEHSTTCEEQTDAQDWALEHTGRAGHDTFRRVFTDHAKVTRADGAG